MTGTSTETAMTDATLNERAAAALARTSAAQREAADPAVSAWVSANAGTGKTHVLANRVLRLLLAGTEPERILCLTYTKAAAAEMAARVFAELGLWATADATTLERQLRTLTGAGSTPAERQRAATLFAQAIETPGGLKVETIHAFCERLLQRFPLEAGVPAGFSMLDEATTRLLMREAIDVVLLRASAQPKSLEGQALTSIVQHAADDHFESMLFEALNARAWLRSALSLVEDAREDDSDADEMAAPARLYRRHFGLAEDVTIEGLERALDAVIDAATLTRLESHLRTGGKNDTDAAERVATVLRAPTAALRRVGLSEVFLTQKGEPRKALMTKPLAQAAPRLAETCDLARDRFNELVVQRQALAVVTATVAITRLALAVMQGYTQAKLRRAALDFDDLIERTASLLDGDQSAQWVLYKLDGGLDHILVDESQDTSPAQWRVIEKLAAEFFAGAGQSERVRTLFAVGDEKQSIYSFQGAAPQLFAQTGSRFDSLARAAGRSFRHVPLSLSFRSVAPLLALVDRTFTRHPISTAAHGPSIAHGVRRLGHAGLVEVWPTETFARVEPSDAFAPFGEATALPPHRRLARTIAATIAGWIAGGERLTSENRAVEPGDILVLVRKRAPFAPAMVAALKKLGVPVAGADRLVLAEELAVADLVSLGRFLLLPEDDLSLAEVLKSPLIGLDDDDLLALAPNRRGGLWTALLRAADAVPRWRDASAQLKAWRREADFLPPFEFFANVLDRDGMRAKLLAELGLEAADPIDEFRQAAMDFDDSAAPSLSGFLAALEGEAREVKRDMEHGRNEVRVMTVHGAKGLEAPIVFLPDTCTTRSGRRPGSLLKMPGLVRPEGLEVPFCWPVKGASKLPAIAGAKAAMEALDAAERLRLLYVAMTRARDRLIVAGFENRLGRSNGCWYDIVRESLEADPACQRIAHATGEPILRLTGPQTVEPEPRRKAAVRAGGSASLPDWASRPAPRDRQLSIPLRPSRLAPLDAAEDAIGAEDGPGAEDGRGAEDGPDSLAVAPAAGIARARAGHSAAPETADRFLRGHLTHALLQYLPGLPKSSWDEAAAAFLAARGAGLGPGTRRSIRAETLAVLLDPRFAAVFGPQSRSEVPIAALVANPRQANPGEPDRAPLKIVGQIDRLALTPDGVLIVDYKTNRAAPQTVDGVPTAYLQQLAAYRMAVQHVYPGQAVRAALLWTQAPRLVVIPGAMLDAACVKLFTVI